MEFVETHVKSQTHACCLRDCVNEVGLSLVGDVEFEELLRNTWVDGQHLSPEFIE